MRRLPLFLTAAMLFAPVVMEAQRHGGMPMVARPVTVTPRAVPRMAMPAVPVVNGTRVVSGPGTHVAARAGAPLVRVHMPNGTIRVIRRGNHSSFQQNTSDFSAVPGLGFDFVHFAATHPNAGRRHRRINQIGGFFPFFDGGFVIPSAPIVEEVAPVETVQDEEEAVEEAPRRARVTVVQPSPAPTVREPESVRNVEEYVFVRRDGTVFFAVAYSWENGALRYITNQGLRGTVLREALDLSATQQFNEQRGLNFRLPA